VTRPRIVVLGHDAGGNAIGRALVLAELLEPWSTVRILAFGRGVWRPIEGEGAVELVDPPRFTIGLPSAARRLTRAIGEADLLIAVKPRILSYGLAAVVHGDRPLVLDIDDLEHRFTRRRLGWVRQIIEPDREPVTRMLERWRRPVAGLTVASRALQQRYGGAWIPHVRDRSSLAPAARLAGRATRAALGLEESFVIGFVGTIRPHKGLASLADALASLPEDVRLLLAGDLSDTATLRAVQARAPGRVVTVDNVPMSELGALLGACDVIAIPQSRTPEATHQSPAKLLDALAAGKPVVVGDVGDARELLAGAGLLVPPDDTGALAACLSELYRSPSLRERLSAAAIARTEEAFSLGEWRARLAAVLAPHVKSKP
jgi:glycosyltransferase involved in cell wall biosynthesis